MIVKTFDPVTLQEKETISKITSILFYDRFYKVGSFEIETTSDKFQENDIIAFASGGKIRSGIVLKIIEKNDMFSIFGYDLKAIYGFRYITTPSEYTGTADAVLKKMVTEFLKTDDRNIERLEISKDSVPGEGITFTPKQGFLEDAIIGVSALYEVGTRVDFDLEKMIFKTIKGEDRTASVVFGRRRRNLDSVEYTKDLFNTYNVGYTSDDNGNITSVGNAKGILRRECYKDKNVEEYLKEKAEVETLRAEANDLYKYGADYNLGDYVTIIKGNMSTIKQITEVKEVHEHGNTSFYPVFGTEKENPIKKLLRGE